MPCKTGKSAVSFLWQYQISKKTLYTLEDIHQQKILLAKFHENLTLLGGGDPSLGTDSKIEPTPLIKSLKFEKFEDYTCVGGNLHFFISLEINNSLRDRKMVFHICTALLKENERKHFIVALERAVQI